MSDEIDEMSYIPLLPPRNPYSTVILRQINYILEEFKIYKHRLIITQIQLDEASIRNNTTAHQRKVGAISRLIVEIQLIFINRYTERLLYKHERIVTATNDYMFEAAKAEAVTEILRYQNWPQPLFVFDDQIETMAEQALIHFQNITEHRKREAILVGHSSSITIPGCNLSVKLQPLRNSPTLTWGTNGTSEHQLVHPWGIASNRFGEIIVADRLNNRIKIFNSNGEFIMQFGTTGQADGEFHKCAGVAISPQNEIVVADKDNHRIQVFTRTGEFILKFGCFGSRNGEFHYPWDVAINRNGEIAVTDSRNQRIQLFNQTGKYLRSWNSWTKRPVASRTNHSFPRGITFDCDGNILVTDFNLHKIIIINRFDDSVSTFEIEGQFNRPSGICCDDRGCIVVVDTKNNRIQIFDERKHLMRILDGVSHVTSEAPSIFNRPSDVCIDHEGRLFVVDSNNDRIHKF